MYNATVRSTRHGEAWGTFVAEVAEINGRLQMLRSNSVQCTGFEGKVLTAAIPELGAEAGDAAYDIYLRACNGDLEYTVTEDDCEGYKNCLRGMALPPAYRAAL